MGGRDLGTIRIRSFSADFVYATDMIKTSFCIALFSLLFCGCQSIPDGRDPVYAKGETVIELLSGREGIVEDGYYSHFQRSWRYRTVRD